MSQPESTKFSYVRGLREVIPSTSLKAFLNMAREFAQDEAFEVGEGMSDLTIYAGNSLRVTMFERRARAGHEANKLLNRLHYRMESPTILTTERVRTNYGAIKSSKKREPNMLHKALREAEFIDLTAVPLVMRANKIVDSTKDDYRGHGTELALVLDGGPAARVLENQRDHLMSASQGINFMKRLPPSDPPDPVLHLPFMCAPFAGQLQRDQFIELMSTELPVHEIALGPIEWTLKTRAPKCSQATR